MSLPVKTNPTFEAGQPVTLFQTPIAISSNFPVNRRYDVAPDGQRFLMLVPALTDPSSTTAIVNWPAILNKK
jgi:hypothetical protein